MAFNNDDHLHDHAGSCFVCTTRTRHDKRGYESTPGNRRTFLKGAIAAPLLVSPLAGCLAEGNSDRNPAGNPDGAQSVPEGTYVIQAGWALIEDSGEARLLRDASILVRDGLIEEVSESEISGFSEVNARDQLVLPGFISGHTHACSATPTRGIIEVGRSFARPLELVEKLSDSEMDALTAFNVAELLLGGSTTHVEMSLSLRQTKSYVRVARRWGVRGYPGGMTPGIARLFPIWFRDSDQALFDSVEGTLAEIQANLEYARSVNGAENGRILPQMAPHATDTQTPETMRAIAAGAAELGNGIHIHLSQSAGETATVRRLWGMTPTQWCEQFGFYNGSFFGAHMSGLDFDVDPPILNAGAAVYAHCPSAGGAGGGTQPYPEALGANMNVNIGIDTHSNDYVENLKLSVLYGQARFDLLKESSPLPLRQPTIWDSVRGATTVAADGLRRPDLGRIRSGAKADLVGIDVSSALVGSGTLPPEPLSNLLYANGKSVRLVITDGNVQVMNGGFVVDDLSQVAREGGEVVQHIWDELRGEGFFDLP